MAAFAQSGKILLAKDLIEGNGHRIGEIQASQMFPHRDPDAVRPVFIQERFRQAGGFFSEHEKNFFGLGTIRIFLRGFGTEKENGGMRML